MRGRLRDRAARRIAGRILRGIRGGRIEVAEDGGRTSFGTSEGELHAQLEVRDPAAWTKALHGSTGFGEGYVDGLWDVDDLVTLNRIAARNAPALDRAKQRWSGLLVPAQRLGRLVPRNTRRGARRNISAHYDLGNDLFGAFLDERMQYSAAVFPGPGVTLEEAQLAKLDRICRALRLGPGQHLLEIGTGWGGLAVHAAKHYGCRVTTTTISREQRDHARELVRERGLDGLVEVLDRDYRDLEGAYDKLVSIEMIEAVGWQYFGEFFRRCSGLLRDDGLMFLQAIVISDHAYELEKASKSFANTHVFPGGCLPSRQVIADLVAGETDMRSVWSEDIAPHYAETLRIWRERFEAAWPGLEARGYDERFRRLWRFYLAFCEAGFRERRIGDMQILLAKPAFRDDSIPVRSGLASPAAGSGSESPRETSTA